MRLANFGRIACVALVVASPLAVRATPPQMTVTYTDGTNVSYVVLGDKGKVQGAFRQKRGGGWEEIDAAGKVLFSYTEQKRERWLVEVFDASRNVRVRFDLQRSKVAYAEGDGAMTDRYDLLFADSLTH